MRNAFEESVLKRRRIFGKLFRGNYTHRLRVAKFRVKSSVKGLKGSIRRMTRVWMVVKQWHSERFARKRRVGQFVGQFLRKIVRSLSRAPEEHVFVCDHIVRYLIP